LKWPRLVQLEVAAGDNGVTGFPSESAHDLNEALES
jgi:hypothetical protein